MRGNKLLPLLLISVICIMAALLYAKNQPDAKESLFGLRKPASKAPEIDADLPQNTLDRLAVDSATLKEKIKGYSESMTAQERQLHDLTDILKEMRSENGTLRKQLEQQSQQLTAVQQESSSSKLDTENLKHELLGSLEDPTFLLNTEVNMTPSSPPRTLSGVELVRYLDYCAELLALIGKLTAYYAQRHDDPKVHDMVNDIEMLTNNLARKIWQKIAVIHGQ